MGVALYAKVPACEEIERWRWLESDSARSTDGVCCVVCEKPAAARIRIIYKEDHLFLDLSFCLEHMETWKRHTKAKEYQEIGAVR
jgi:hypothetical protein